MNFLRKVLCWLLTWLPFRQPKWTAQAVDDLPDTLKKHRVYVVGENGHVWQVAMMCPCGCGAVIQLCLLPESSPSWAVMVHADRSVSLHPSVWRTTGCRSHFFLREGRVAWCGDLAAPHRASSNRLPSWGWAILLF